MKPVPFNSVGGHGDYDDWCEYGSQYLGALGVRHGKSLSNRVKVQRGEQFDILPSSGHFLRVDTRMSCVNFSDTRTAKSTERI